jgi:hypothetical protein
MGPSAAPDHLVAELHLSVDRFEVKGRPAFIGGLLDPHPSAQIIRLDAVGQQETIKVDVVSEPLVVLACAQVD